MLLPLLLLLLHVDNNIHENITTIGGLVFYTLAWNLMKHRRA